MKTILSALLMMLLLAGCSSTPPSPRPHPTAATPSPAPTPAPRTNHFEADLQKAAAAPSLPFGGESWHSMFNGEDLTGWRETPFAGHGELECRSGLMVLGMGDPFTGVNWTNEFPKINYEVALDAVRVTGSDFFCGLTVPVHDTFCSLIVGGWGGSLLGISSIDGMDASENETMKFMNFERNRWYRIRLRVTENRIEGWIDQEKLINLDTTGRKISLRPGEIEESKPMGLASWQTAAAYRHIQWRPVAGPEGKAPRL